MASALSGGEKSSSDLGYALWTLVKPSRFVTRAPSRAGLRYTSEPRRGVPPLCDVYLPEGAGPHPSVIVVHGGGFVIGHRAMKPARLLASGLSEAGHAVCAIDYRLLFRGGGLDAQIADVNAAARFWRSTCERFGCDPSGISMVGLSAGATLAMIHAAASPHPYRRLVSFYGPSDFEQIRGRRASALLTLVLGSSDRSVWRARSPLHAPAPSPMLLMHGTADRMVSPAHSIRLHERRAQLGLLTELELVDSMRHGWLNDFSLRQSHEAVERVRRFLDGDASASPRPRPSPR